MNDVDKSEMNASERHLLQWLADGGGIGQYGECHGAPLDNLIEKGFVMVWGAESGTKNDFIAKGSSLMHRQVSITDEGRAALTGGG